MKPSPKNIHITFECAAEGHLVKILTNCSRCGGTHEDLTFKPFHRPPGRYTHYAPCPTTHEPILMKLVVTKTKKGKK